MDRRKFLLGVSGTAIGGGALLGSGAFSRVESQRAVSIEVAEDPDAYLGLQGCPGSPNQSYTNINEDGHLEVDMSPDNPTDAGGMGINSNSFTWFDDVFQVCNQGKQDIGLWVQAEDSEEIPDLPEEYAEDGPRVRFYTGPNGEPQRISAPDAETAVENGWFLTLPVGECVCVGIRALSKGLTEGDQLVMDGGVVIHADADLADEDTGITPAPDVPILNFALTLEHLEYAFYRDGLAEFTDEELMEADVLSEFGDTVQTQVPAFLETIEEHELVHVDALTETIEALNGVPVEEAEYDFSYETPSEFLAVAQALENTGVSAYAGGATPIVNNDILAAAASIHSVEARHASFLNFVNSDLPYPDVVDEARTIPEVLDIIEQFITSEIDEGKYELGDDRPPHDRKADDGVSDIEVLNFALTLEHLENAFYRDGLAEFSDEDLINADVLDVYDETVRTSVPDLLELAGDHEEAHVVLIEDTIEVLGGDPVEELTYDFGYETPSEFLGVAAALENTGVSAYAGAAPSVANDDVFDAAIGIHSVEARHAAMLNELNVESPFPNAFDPARTMEEVEEIISQFIVEE